ncbi:MAG: hypothetical protein CO108_28450, partial [Deltaproteobacteria bacterium CG_4_9_14_3_um_filter_63_12]
MIKLLLHGSRRPALFAQGSALGWELFGPRGADAQSYALGSTALRAVDHLCIEPVGWRESRLWWKWAPKRAEVGAVALRL